MNIENPLSNGEAISKNLQDDEIRLKPENFNDEKYQERKKLIKTPDDELIKKALEKKFDFQDSTVGGIIEDILFYEENFRNKMKNKPLYDIGCGKQGVFSASMMLGLEPALGPIGAVSGDKKLDLGIKKYFLVDPYLKHEFIGIELNHMQMQDKEREELEAKVEFEQKDGLTFLLSQKSESGNIITSTIDFSLIPNEEYLQRLAQEIYRVTPEDGIFVSRASSSIEQEAEQLFPISIKGVSGSKIFFKKDETKPMKNEQNLKNDFVELIEKYNEAFFPPNIMVLKESFTERMKEEMKKIFTSQSTWGRIENVKKLYKQISESHKDENNELKKVRNEFKKFLKVNFLDL